MLSTTRPLALACVVALGVTSACNRLTGSNDTSGGGPGPGSTSSPPSRDARGAGPSVAIPAGAFKAGVTCGGVPRVTTEELVGPSITLGDFSMDVYPFPNDPLQPAKVDVTQADAEKLCAGAGKRLCTELEWERACKGPSSTTFEYGAGFDANACKLEADLLPGKRARCVSAFGVKDMHGLVWEWTKSSWGRGTNNDLVTVRGGGGVTVLQGRCANGQGRAPTVAAHDVGFRCCSGAVNSASVELTLSKQPAIAEDAALDSSLGAAMLKAMPQDHRVQASAEVAFDKVWRWHPRDNEELLIGRWVGKPKDGSAPYFELAVFKVCFTAPGLIARFRGPVASVQAPGAAADPTRASASIQTNADKGDAVFTYSHGAVKVEEPAWVQAGSALATGSAPRIPVLKPPKGH